MLIALYLAKECFVGGHGSLVTHVVSPAPRSGVAGKCTVMYQQYLQNHSILSKGGCARTDVVQI